MKIFTSILLGVSLLFSMAKSTKLLNNYIPWLENVTFSSIFVSAEHNGNKEGPDLNKYYEDFMATLGEDNTPAMMDVEGDFISLYYPGLENIPTKQAVLKTAMISMAAYEFALVEVEDASKVQEVADIFQARIDYQIENGAFYPMTLEGWEKAQVITNGNVVALVCAGDQQDQAVDALMEEIARLP